MKEREGGGRGGMKGKLGGSRDDFGILVCRRFETLGPTTTPVSLSRMKRLRKKNKTRVVYARTRKNNLLCISGIDFLFHLLLSSFLSLSLSSGGELSND